MLTIKGQSDLTQILPHVLAWGNIFPWSFLLFFQSTSECLVDAIRELGQGSFHGVLGSHPSDCMYRTLSAYGQSGHGSYEFINKILIAVPKEEKVWMSVCCFYLTLDKMWLFAKRNTKTFLNRYKWTEIDQTKANINQNYLLILVTNNLFQINQLKETAHHVSRSAKFQIPLPWAPIR